MWPHGPKQQHFRAGTAHSLEQDRLLDTFDILKAFVLGEKENVVPRDERHLIKIE